MLAGNHHGLKSVRRRANLDTALVTLVVRSIEEVRALYGCEAKPQAAPVSFSGLFPSTVSFGKLASQLLLAS